MASNEVIFVSLIRNWGVWGWWPWWPICLVIQFAFMDLFVKKSVHSSKSSNMHIIAKHSSAQSCWNTYHTLAVVEHQTGT